jgi:hypothetical protein
MRVAILGGRGSPAEELASRLTQRGHEVVVFTATFLGALRCARHSAKPDVALLLRVSDSPLCLITHGHGIPTVISIDGLDSLRPWPARIYLRFAERNAPRWADTVLTESHAVAEAFEQRYGQRIAVTGDYERLLESVVAMAGPGSLPAELLDPPR